MSDDGNAGGKDFTYDYFEDCYYNVDTFEDRCTLTLTTLRTATLPTATRRTVASTTAKECTRHRVQSRSIHWQEVWSESRSRPNYTH